MSKETLKNKLNKKVFAVWLIQDKKRFLLNYFNCFETACAYVNGFKHYNIAGELLFGEVSLKYLVEQEV